jgi:hypothetical protein
MPRVSPCIRRITLVVAFRVITLQCFNHVPSAREKGRLHAQQGIAGHGVSFFEGWVETAQDSVGEPT